MSEEQKPKQKPSEVNLSPIDAFNSDLSPPEVDNAYGGGMEDEFGQLNEDEMIKLAIEMSLNESKEASQNA